MRPSLKLGATRPLVLFASGAGVGRVVESWRRGGLTPVHVDVTELDLRSALLAEASVADLRLADISVNLRLAPNSGVPTRLEIGDVLAAHRQAIYAVAGPASFVLRIQRALSAFGVEALGLSPRLPFELDAA